MISPINILALIIAYLMGSIPSSVWIGKMFYNIDVREFGSGNAGATNTFRVLGKKAGIPVLIIDILKGWLPVFCIRYMIDLNLQSEEFINLQLALGVATLIGHIFPVYVGFRGGKGVATMLGIVLALNLDAALVSIVVFLTVFLITNYVSLSSIAGALSFPIMVIVVFHTTIPSMALFSLVVFVMVLVTHQKNIERLFNKKEAKIRFIFKKKDESSHVNESQTSE